MHRSLACALAFAALVLASPIDAAEMEIVETQLVTLRVQTMVAGLEHPWGLAFLPDGSLLVTERPGRLRRVAPDGSLSDPIVGVPKVFAHGQGGLLDVAVHPRFDDDPWIYLSYAAGDRDAAGTEVARARLRGDALTDLEVVFRAQPRTPGGLHYGSRLLFAPDGTLFVTLGERYTAMERAQDPRDHLGTIARIRDDGGIPADNPFADGVAGAPEVYSYGHRNVQGIALHPDRNEIWAHEHGPMGGDEINVLVAGANYGWPIVTHGRDYSGAVISDRTQAPGITPPIHQWTPSIAPSGMAFYAGAAFPEWRGDLLVGSLKFMHLRRLRLEGSRVVHEEELLRARRERIRDVEVGPDGAILLITDEPDGRLLRLEPADH